MKPRAFLFLKSKGLRIGCEEDPDFKEAEGSDFKTCEAEEGLDVHACKRELGLV